jgi:hypothetical protein
MAGITNGRGLDKGVKCSMKSSDRGIEEGLHEEKLNAIV